MTKSLFVFIAIVFQNIIYAQAGTAWFETFIYVEDAVGNFEEVTLGFDLNDIPGDTAQFHEILDESPFDSVFEVRLMSAADYYDDQNYCPTYKRLIRQAIQVGGAPDCLHSGNFVIMVRAIHQPVKIIWDRSAFLQSCRDVGFFTPDLIYATVNPVDWVNYPTSVWWCASKSDSLVYDLSSEVVDGYRTESIRDLNNGTMDTLFGLMLRFAIFYNESPCSLVATDEAGNDMVRPSGLYPNPSNAGFRVVNNRSNQMVNIDLYNASNSLVHSKKVQSQDEMLVALPTLCQGVYFAVLTWEDGYRETKKWVRY